MIADLLKGKVVALNLSLEHLYIFTGILIIYLLFRPLIKWIISMQSSRLLCYIVSSLVFLVFMLTGTVLTGEMDLWLLSVTLQTLSVFGGLMGLLYLFRRLVKKA